LPAHTVQLNLAHMMCCVKARVLHCEQGIRLLPLPLPLQCLPLNRCACPPPAFACLPACSLPSSTRWTPTPLPLSSSAALAWCWWWETRWGYCAASQY
jgi:hypothetical protein